MSVWNLSGAADYMDDEGTYTAQAFSVLEGELAPYTYWYDHPPLGWIQLGGLAWLPDMLGLGDGSFIGTTRYAIAPFFVATALLIYLIARRLDIHRAFAALGVAVFIFSPLSLVFGRSVYLDNIGATWLLLAFWMAISPRTALWHHIGAGLFFALAVLSKETLALFGPALMIALLNRPSWANRKFSIVGFLAVGGIVLGFYPLTAILRGELVPGPDHVSLQEALEYQLMNRSGSGSIWDADSNAAEHLRGWLNFDTHIIVAGLLAGLFCLMQRNTLWITVVLAFAALPVVSGRGYLPAMYIAAILPFLALSLSAGLNIAWGWLAKSMAYFGPEARSSPRQFGATYLAVGLLVMTGPQWFGPNKVLLTQEANNDWTTTLQWVKTNVPREDTVVVPYVMWKDLSSAGRNDPWTVVATEKVDLDVEFLIENPRGSADIEWVVVGPFTRAAIESHGLTMVSQALENSVEVKTVGAWSVHRIELD
ncbi:glycosyltransferase family 39 protein [Kocuria sp. CPCC 205292]|uniref:ArnT family glycosyltransferase n=1 Tax=Kocuria cellulosilytica TaxID=3071451 RepID=UPI0034D6DE0D